MAKYGIISAMQIESNLIVENMALTKVIKLCGFKFHIGTIGDVEVVLTNCSVGKVNAACCTQALIDHFKVDYIINTGIAGAINHRLKLKDIVISSDTTYFDVRKIQMKTCYPYQENFKASKELIDIYVEACKQILPIDNSYYVNRIASGDNFVSDDKLKQSIAEEFTPYCVEMEGAAIGHVSHLNNIPFVIIRSISDLADDVAESVYDNFEKEAALQSAKITIKMLELSKIYLEKELIS